MEIDRTIVTFFYVERENNYIFLQCQEKVGKIVVFWYGTLT